jgi:hypothetical protein
LLCTVLALVNLVDELAPLLHEQRGECELDGLMQTVDPSQITLFDTFNKSTSHFSPH